MSNMEQPKLSNEQMVEQMVDQVQEMVEASQAVRGEAFTRAVTALFHQLQLVWVVAALESLAHEDNRAEAAALVQALLGMVSSTMSALTVNLSPADKAEARNLAEQMHKRQVSLAANWN